MVLWLLLFSAYSSIKFGKTVSPSHGCIFLFDKSSTDSFKKSREYDVPRETLERQRAQLMSAMDGQSSPSEGSSGALNPQTQDGQDMQYQATSQESHDVRWPSRRYAHPLQDGIGEAMRPLSSSTDQGDYCAQSVTGYYMGHPEVQDERL